MQTALNYIYDIFDSFITFIFDTCTLFTGVSIGWVAISIIIFYFVISNLLTIPRGGGHAKERKES